MIYQKDMLKGFKKFGTLIAIGLFGSIVVTGFFFLRPEAELALGAPVFRQEASLIPITDSTYYLGTSTPSLKAWKGLYVDEICLDSDCKTAWPTSGGGSGGGTFSTTTSQVPGQLINYPNNTTDVVNIGSTATTSGEWWYDPNVFVGYLKGKFGIGTTSPYAPLSVSGEIVGASFTGTTTATSTLGGGLSATRFSASASSTLVGLQIPTGGLSIGTLGTGLLETNSGIVGLATSGTDYEVPVTAGDGLTRTANDFDCDTASGSVFGCLAAADWTTFNNSVDTSLTLTVAGTANQITSSAGAQDLSANRTWTLSIPSLFNITQASTTMFSSIGPIFVGTTATTTIRGDTGTSTFAAGISGTRLDFSATSTLDGLVVETGGLKVPTLVSCDTVDTAADGTLKCGADATGAGGTANQWATSTADATAIHTTGAAKVGIATTSPYAALSVVGEIVGSYFTGTTTSTSTLTGGLQTNILRSTLSPTFASLTSALLLTDANGLLSEYTGATCTNQFVRVLSVLGAATCATVSLTADITGTLAIANGGTNATAFVPNTLAFFDGTRLVSTSTSPLYVGSIFATTTASSTLPNITSTMLGVGTICLTGDICRTTWPTSGSGGANSKWATSTLPTFGIYPNGATYVGIGTSTPRYNLQLASSTAPQLVLSDNTNPAWAWRAAGNNLYLATTSPTTFGTSSPSALEINGLGSGALGIGTSTVNATKGQLSLFNLADFTHATSTFYGTGGINIAAGCFSIASTCVGKNLDTASSTLTADVEPRTMSGISVTANDTVLMWGKAEDTSCSAGTVYELKLKQSTFAASTTIDDVTGTQAGITTCNFSLFGSFDSTTTETINFEIDRTGGSGTAGNLKVMYHVIAK